MWTSGFRESESPTRFRFRADVRARCECALCELSVCGAIIGR
ncbi:hypothetical protein [Alloactinosynnema sp. L-07]|nr:hypothetical protein [Alloactinosynnema sp. L-07]